MKTVQFPTRLLTLLILIGLSTAFTAPAVRTSNGKKTINVKNTTKFDIDHVYLSPDEEDHWGDDILDDNEILHPGDDIDVEVDCGKWDVKLIAQDKSECQIEDITLCDADQWNIVADCPH